MASVSRQPHVTTLESLDRRLRTAEACIELIAWIGENEQIPADAKGPLFASILIGLRRKSLEEDLDSALAAATADRHLAQVRELLRRVKEGGLS